MVAEVEWSITTTPENAVQFSLSGNSPLALSQIAAFNVDNSHCGVDVQFLFPDSGSRLVVPAYNQGLYPVFTNALMFYAFAPGAAAGDMTIFCVLNTIPPPVAVQPTSEQAVATQSGIALDTIGQQEVIPPPTNGTLESFQLLFSNTGTAVDRLADVQLVDGNGHVLWLGVIDTSITTLPITVSGLRARFYNGLFLVVPATTMTQGQVNINVYYSIP